MLKLDIIQGPDAGATFKPEETSFIIGRGRTNRIILLDSKVSSRHSQIECRGGQYLVRDLDSTNGTFVNEQPVREQALVLGDQIRVGQSVIRVSMIELAKPAQAGKVTLSDGDGQIAPVHIRIEPDQHPRLEMPPAEATLPVLVEAYRNLLAMYKVSGIIRKNPDIEKLLHDVLSQIFKNVRAERGTIMLIDDNGDLLQKAFRALKEDPAEREMHISKTIVKQVIEQCDAIMTSDATIDERFKKVESVQAQHIRSAMCVPVSAKGRVLGIIYVDTRNEAGMFSKADLELLTAIGNEAGIAVENRMLREANIKAERLAAVGQTVAGLSHYIKNVLQCMSAGSDVVNRGIEDGNIESVRKGWGIVRRNEERISELVLDMLNYSSEKIPMKTMCSLNDIVDEAVETIALTAKGKGIGISKKLDPNLPKVPVDKLGIYRSLLNLLTNSLDALEGLEGGTIRLATSREGSQAIVTVSDNGPGIPEQNRAKIFDIFFTTKGEKGTGFGLAVVRKIMREHLGEIILEDTPNGGASFKIMLPIQPTEIRQS